MDILMNSILMYPEDDISMLNNFYPILELYIYHLKHCHPNFIKLFAEHHASNPKKKKKPCETSRRFAHIVEMDFKNKSRALK